MYNILIIGSVWPEPGSSAAGSRMMELIHLWQDQGWKITFASAAADSEFMEDLSATGVKKVTIELNSSSFDSFIQDLQPGIVLFDRFMTEEQFGWRVADNCPYALRVLDTEDLHCLRAARQKAYKENRELKHEDLFSETAKREIASILRCDLSLIISRFEMALLRDTFKVDEALLYYLPFMLEPADDEAKSHLPSFESREHFITIGNFLHEPNWNSVLFLKEEIWPLIRKNLPQAEMHVYGAYPTQKVFQLHKPGEGFFIKGRAKDAKEVMCRARVCLAPLRFGAGLKGKLAEAMQCGTPNITTAIGAEAMQGGMEWSGTIAITARDFADAATGLYTDKNTWQKAQENGFHIINTLFSKEKAGKDLISHLLSLKENLEEHRLTNFTGSMLMHHTLASTRYMSKWIEAKNQDKKA